MNTKVATILLLCLFSMSLFASQHPEQKGKAKKTSGATIVTLVSVVGAGALGIRA